LAEQQLVTTDAGILDRFREYRRTGERSIRNELIEAHRWIAVRCARRFEGRGEPLDDLEQVAQLGVLKAVERFDPDRGTAFSSFAMPTVTGELRRHFRDTTWSVNVPRRMKELHVALSGATETLLHELGRQPSVNELADHLHVTVDDVLDALEAGSAYRAGRLAREDDEGSDVEVAAARDDDAALVDAADRIAVRRLLGALKQRERTIVYLRFFGGLTQEEIAERVGMSQVHVSRLLRASLTRLRDDRASGPSVR
jgi:RNA polymerase sigma-B factor